MGPIAEMLEALPPRLRLDREEGIKNR